MDQTATYREYFQERDFNGPLKVDFTEWAAHIHEEKPTAREFLLIVTFFLIHARFEQSLLQHLASQLQDDLGAESEDDLETAALRNYMGTLMDQAEEVQRLLAKFEEAPHTSPYEFLETLADKDEVAYSPLSFIVSDDRVVEVALDTSELLLQTDTDQWEDLLREVTLSSLVSFESELLLYLESELKDLELEYWRDGKEAEARRIPPAVEVLEQWFTDLAMAMEKAEEQHEVTQEEGEAAIERTHHLLTERPHLATMLLDTLESIERIKFSWQKEDSALLGESTWAQSVDRTEEQIANNTMAPVEEVVEGLGLGKEDASEPQPAGPPVPLPEPTDLPLVGAGGSIRGTANSSKKKTSAKKKSQA